MTNGNVSSSSSEESDVDLAFDTYEQWPGFWDAVEECPLIMPETGVSQDQQYDNWESSEDGEETMLQKEEGAQAAAGVMIMAAGGAGAGVTQAMFLFSADDNDDDDAAAYEGDDEMWSVNGEVDEEEDIDDLMDGLHERDYVTEEVIGVAQIPELHFILNDDGNDLLPGGSDVDDELFIFEDLRM